jgi:hypothetical protein
MMIFWDDDPVIRNIFGEASAFPRAVRPARSPLMTIASDTIQSLLRHRSISLSLVLAFVLAAMISFPACETVGRGSDQVIVVNSLADTASPAAGETTLRSALAEIESGGTITFDAALDGGTIELTVVGESHSVLKGELFVMSGGTWVFEGYQERDYGRSALYARKDLAIDASDLRDGITLKWAGDDANRARVLAVYGDLTMKNVTVVSGYSSWEEIAGGEQPYTLARGGGLAVWGKATLSKCTVAGNRVLGDPNGSRDRGSFGGGIYANRLALEDCVVSGNSVAGYGGAGGGVYSVGGADDNRSEGSTLERSVFSGNRVTAQHAYGGGVYTDGGGRGLTKTLEITNCTIAGNLVEDNPEFAENPYAQYYYRGGGVYMSNGSLAISSSTIAQNAVTGVPAIFSGKPNMGGGGVAATIGNAHVVENMAVWHSIVAGNTVGGEPEDLFTGSLLHFMSYGYNRVGKLDFTYILVPVPIWESLSRKHWPGENDVDGVEAADVLDLAGARRHGWILSAGVDAGAPAVLWYPPAGSAEDVIPFFYHDADSLYVEDPQYATHHATFLPLVLEQIRTVYGSVLGYDFGAALGDVSGIAFHGPAVEWPSTPENAPWIDFWRAVDAEIGERLGAEKLGDAFWASFDGSGAGGAGGLVLTVRRKDHAVRLAARDQLGVSRPHGNNRGDIGAIEK